MELNFRQVHLDFHTSPAIPGIGADFNPQEFAATLDRARVNSITCFARCHHGLLYYDSALNPERIHPKLVRPNLLRDQIEACHAVGIRVPIYITVQWDEYSADHHREWLVIDEDGKEIGTKPLEAGFYRFLDVFHPGYRKFLFDHVQEVLTTLPVDGLFFDICQPRPSLAIHWIEAMDRAGLNPESKTDREAFARTVMDDWQEEMTAFVRRFNADCTIFYNSGHVGPAHRSSMHTFTHWELESLPSGGWGYLHFPQAQRFARTLGMECLGMTGKFHTSWGDFHSYKNLAALQFECFHMLALTAKCSVGDQLHPSGLLDETTYELIGNVYADVEKKEPWCTGAVAVSDVALMTVEEFAPAEGRVPASVLGAIRMLQELRVQFDIVDSQSNFMGYRLLILPDGVPFNTRLSAKIDAFLASGGSIIASYHSGLDSEGHFASSDFGVKAIGEAPFSPDFVVPGEGIGKDLAKTGHVMYRRALEVEPQSGSDVLCYAQTPYFNRTWRHFCSHRHTPSSGEQGYPAVVQYGPVIYFAHPIFQLYHDNAALWVKQFVKDALGILLPTPVLEVDGPSTIIATVNHQEAQNRHVIHLLHYIPERRGREFDVIEEVIPLSNVTVRFRPTANVSSVRLVPEGMALVYTREDGVVSFTVPTLVGHAMIEVA